VSRRVVAGAVVVAVVATALGVGPAYAAAPAAGGTNCLPAPEASDPSVPWAQQQLAPQRVWELTRGAGVTVAVVDTGVDASTPQLRGQVLAGVDITGKGGAADKDCYGHGTFVAGIIAAKPAEGTGFAGVAPAAKILPIRATAPAADGSAGDLTAGALAAGIRAAVDGGATVVNVSASTSTPDSALADAVRYAAAKDVVVVASAANGAQNGDPVTYPASYESVLAVGAVDSAGQHAQFSQTGPYLDLVAPGVDVVSVGPGGPGQWQGSGTSYAAPFVAGTAALVRAYHPDLTAPQVMHRLEATANHPAANLPDPALGWGTVNPMAAVTAVLPEESVSGADLPLIGPAPARPAPPELVDEIGPAMVVIGIIGGVGAAFAIVVIARLSDGGRRRGWRPARVAVEPPAPARAGPPHH
jgi:membrane-anchored mycosin MYCP